MYHYYNPCFAPNLLTERLKRRQLERTWRNSCNEADRLLNKNHCHLYNSLVKKPSLITFHFCSKPAQIQNLCGIQSTKFVIAPAHPHLILHPLFLLITLVLFLLIKLKLFV